MMRTISGNDFLPKLSYLVSMSFVVPYPKGYIDYLKPISGFTFPKSAVEICFLMKSAIDPFSNPLD